MSVDVRFRSAQPSLRKMSNMNNRVNIHQKGQAAMKAIYGLPVYLAKSSIESSLKHLLSFRVSQINGCAFCLDMHSKDLRAEGETEQRLYVLDAWREAPFYSDRERAALAFAESLTKLENGQLPDAVYDEASSHFSEQELIDLLMIVITINSYNRVNIAFPGTVGSYQPGAYAVKGEAV